MSIFTVSILLLFTDNYFTGTVPTELALTNATFFSVVNSPLFGPLPSSVGPYMFAQPTAGPYGNLTPIVTWYVCSTSAKLPNITVTLRLIFSEISPPDKDIPLFFCPVTPNCDWGLSYCDQLPAAPPDGVRTPSIMCPKRGWSLPRVKHHTKPASRS